jgi:hypothetical protein
MTELYAALLLTVLLASVILESIDALKLLVARTRRRDRRYTARIAARRRRWPNPIQPMSEPASRTTAPPLSPIAIGDLESNGADAAVMAKYVHEKPRHRRHCGAGLRQPSAL